MADAPNSINQVSGSLSLNDIVEDNIITNSDIDYFKIPASAISQDSILNLNFSGLGASADEDEFLVSIRDASDTVLESTNVGSDLILSESVNANTAYYVRVERGENLRLDDYSLSVDLLPVIENEDNDISISASPLVPDSVLTGGGAVVKGALGSTLNPNANDLDWYSFTTGSQIGTSVSLTVSAATTDADVYTVSVYDSSVDEIVRNQSGQPLTTTVGANDGVLTFNVTGENGLSPSGTYFVSVQALDAASFTSTTEAGQQYSIALSGTTDFNVAPVLSVGTAKSGLSGSIRNSDVVISNSTLVDPDVEPASRIFYTDLSDKISVNDKNDDTVNGAILSYAVGLLNEANFANANGSIVYTDDNTSDQVTISAKSNIGVSGFFVDLSPNEFASARYQSGNTSQEQVIYVYAKDGSNVSTDIPALLNPGDLSGILSFTISTEQNLGDLPTSQTVDLGGGGSATVSASASFWQGGEVLAGQNFSVLADGQSSSLTSDVAGVIDLSQFIGSTVRVSATLENKVADNVDLIDALQIVKHLDGSEVLSGSAILAADVNADGIINATDVSELLSILVRQKDADLVLFDGNGASSFDVSNESTQLTGVVIGDVNGTYADIL